MKCYGRKIIAAAIETTESILPLEIDSWNLAHARNLGKPIPKN